MIAVMTIINTEYKSIEMKSEINKKNRAKFFSQYYRQLVMTDGKNVCHVDPKIASDRYYLELKGLSQISDEDAIEVAKIINDAPFLTFKKWQTERYAEAEAGCDGIKVFARHSLRYYTLDFDGQFDYIDEETGHEMLGYADFPGAYDFLRDRGYAVPFNKITVEEQIAAGWVKLKS